MTATPRTDAKESIAAWPGRWVYASFARELEVELNALVERNAALVERWRRDAEQYQRQVEEARAKGIEHQGMLAMATCLRACAKDLTGGGR